ncbi:mavicyanin-like [Dioscorea cayenensis subsp. rotundata]|uniref:Mavicyanin-like n=1 Tax=Dioscorea cayennensis subsp. rotundata TaxID=55577 RepID=A0AB40BTH0_DIOCR|nr:mavicyanin-like [Dioscorea cayenensis subsp. rotundata]
MPLIKFVITLSLIFYTGPSQGKVYKVGDSSGWTIIGNVNYTAWASSKTFRVGDTIGCSEYNKQFHNVLEVKEADFFTCTTESLLASFITGNDSIPIKQAGQRYFICGFPGHCDGGQKVEIMVHKLTSSSAAPPTSSAVVPSTSPGASPTNPNNAASETHKALYYFSLAVVFVSTLLLV